MSSSDLRELEIKMPNIIGELDAIQVRHDTFIKSTKARFNIFTTLRNAHEEVGLHSKFLALLLDANGLHDCGDLFLELFLEVLNEEGVLNHSDEPVKDVFTKLLNDTFKQIELEKRKYRSDGTPYGDIDIGIFFKDSVIIIENKIDAYEQEEQIERYCDYVKDDSGKENKFVLYLTLDGKKSETAGEHENNYYRVSYSHHILKWLELCLKETYKYPNINIAIQQYKDVVNKLLNRNQLTEVDMEEMTKLIRKYPQIIRHADNLKTCVDDIQRKIIDQFWDCLKYQFRAEEKDIISGNGFEDFLLIDEDTPISADSKIRFFVEKSTTGIYCGLGLRSCESDLEKEDIYKTNRSVFGGIEKHLRNNSKFNIDYSKDKPWWPVGALELNNFDSEWYIGIMQKEEKAEPEEVLKIEAKKTVTKVKQYVEFVQKYCDGDCDSCSDSIPGEECKREIS